MSDIPIRLSGVFSNSKLQVCTVKALKLCCTDLAAFKVYGYRSMRLTVQSRFR
jgi:hypothetical protein